MTGGAPSYEGRDNANQITLNDGIPPITNQYLFQPIAGAFYAPCVDGDMDTSVFGHEYTHLISNRMVAGPDSGLSGDQAGAMGESWSDLDAEEYLHENGFVPTNGENPWAVGAYATGNKDVGIRDYALDSNPLNYSDVGFDTPGAEVHADGEIWNGANYEVRQALVDKYDATFPSSDAALQKRCADGILPADQCPGNRRWIQLVYDGWLLDQSGPSMLDARDSYLAADVMRFGGANQTAIWHAFAARGMGNNASSTSTDDNDPIPGFASPNESNATVTFNATAPDEGNAAVKAKIYVGKYEAGVTPRRRHRRGHDAAGIGEVRRRDVRLRRTGAGLRPVPLHADVHGRTDGHGERADAHELGIVEQGRDRLGRRHEYRQPDRRHREHSVGVGHRSGRRQAGHGDARRRRAHDHPRAGERRAQRGPGSLQRAAAVRDLGVHGFRGKRQLHDRVHEGVHQPGRRLPGRRTEAGRTEPDHALVHPAVRRSARRTSGSSSTRSQCTGGPAYAGEQDNDPTNSTDCTANSADAGQVIAAELEAFGAPPAPDLQVTALTATKTGDKYVYAATVTNTGNASAGASVTQLTLDGVQVCSLATAALAAGASTTVTCTTKPKAGTHTLVATADATGVVAESNEANNARSTTFKS